MQRNTILSNCRGLNSDRERGGVARRGGSVLVEAAMVLIFVLYR
jgi:hypothetical protein